MTAAVSARDENNEPGEDSLLLNDTEEPCAVTAAACDVPIKPQVPAGKQKKKKRKAAWVDPDTEKTKIDVQNAPRLRKLKASASEAVMQGAQCHQSMLYV